MAQNFPKRKRGFRFFKWLFIFILAIVGTAILFVNYKKNEIAKTLLNNLNSSIEGEVTIGGVKIGEFMDYPDLTVQIKDVAIYNSKQDSLPTDAIIEVSKLFVSANLEDILNGIYHIQAIDLRKGTYKIAPGNDMYNIGKAFSINTPQTFQSSTNPAQDFRLIIDTINAQDLFIDMDFGSDIPPLSVNIEALNGKFTFINDTIGGILDLKGHSNPIPLDSTFSIQTAPIKIKADYFIDLEHELVDVNANDLNLFYTPLSTIVKCNYSESPYLDLKVNSKGETALLNGFSEVNYEDEEFALMNGKATMDLDLNWKPSRAQEFLNQLRCDLILEGNDIVFKGIDLDHYIDNFNRSQNFNLLDMSAVLLTGPVGLAVTKGTDYTMLLTTSPGDSSTIQQLKAHWHLFDGDLTAKDVAFKTNHNLVAANCNYSIPEDSLEMKIMVIDNKGCTSISQSLYGKGEDLKMEKIKVIKTLMGPVTNFIRDIGLGKCTQEYHGAISHPRAKTSK